MRAARVRPWGERPVRAVLTFLACCLVPVLPNVHAAPGPSFADSAEVPNEPHQVGLDAMLALPGHLEDERAVRLAVVAQMEQQGLVAPGTVDRMAPGAVYAVSDPPTRTIHDFHLACDLNGDKVTDVVTSDLSVDTGRSSLYGFNGADGTGLWYRPNLYYFSISGLFPGYPSRGGMPQPQYAPDFAASSDLNGDGVCDFLAYSLEWNSVSTGLGLVMVFTIDVHAVNGRSGADIWNRPFTGAFIRHQVPLEVSVNQVEVVNFPTGFLAFDSPSGPKLVVKLTDITFYNVVESTIDRRYNNYVITDHVHYMDARAAAEGADLWVANLAGDEDAARTNVTWISGVAPLAGGPEPEVVLDQYWRTNPTASTEDNNPITGKPVMRYGRGVSVLALNGDDGKEVWNVGIHTETPGRANLDSEESFESIIWSHATVLDDLTGDGIQDVVATYLTVELNEATSTNGRMRTHVSPIDGATGAKLWGGDHKYRGWGFVASLNAGQGSVPYLAVGTTDIARPNEVPPGGRYPQKFVQLRVLRMADGVPAWTPYEERWSQDTPLVYHLALHQMFAALAPHDWNGDGVRDLVTPARYVRPVHTEQTLLSMARQEYQVLSGADGRVLSTMRAWGGTGMALPCPGAEDQITVLSGHARRLDLSRFDVATGSQLWRHPIYNDPRIQGATLGSDIMFLTGACAETTAPDNRTMIGVNFWRYSPLRMEEIAPVLGFLYDQGTIQWLAPAVNPNPGIVSFLDLLPQPVTPATGIDHAVANGAPLLFGLIAGAGVGLLRNRARRPEEFVLPQ